MVRRALIDHGMNVAEASAAQRMHHQWLPDELRIEEGFSPDMLKLLAAKGHTIKPLPTMGSTQSIMRRADGALYGAFDPKRPSAHGGILRQDALDRRSEAILSRRGERPNQVRRRPYRVPPAA